MTTTTIGRLAVRRSIEIDATPERVWEEFANADRRRSMLELSARGREIHRRIIPLAQEYESELVSNLSPSERQQFLLLLGKLNTEAVRCVK